jgi:hypothetical protein
MDKSLDKIAFTVENRTADVHKTILRLSLPAHTTYELLQDGRPAPMVLTGDWDYPWRAELEVGARGAKVELVRTDRRAIEKKNSNE